MQIDGSRSEISFEEIRIKVPWGHIAGKWYGPRNVRPILGLHGWQDNAGTFDTLAPLLPSNIGFLSIDLPGHGLSSWYPAGMGYNIMDYVYNILLIMKEFKWNRISILSHSLGSFTSFIFASYFPNKVEMLICLDVLHPQVGIDLNYFAWSMEKYLQVDERNQRDGQKEPPTYSNNELIDLYFTGSFGSVYKENCKHILKRSVEKSKIHRDKYYFIRDGRLKYYQMPNTSSENIKNMTKRLNVPLMCIIAKWNKHTPYDANKQKNFKETVETLKKTNSNFEFCEIDGTHHVHLNEPKKVADLINPFIRKYHSVNPNSSINSKL